MENLENKMKGTEVENLLNKMFVGKTKTYIKCIDVDYRSERIEDFWDIQLNVRGYQNLGESFNDYIAVEVMNGENKYFAEGHGLQDAKKGVIFESFPDVLHLHLKRFEYDLNTYAMCKVMFLGLKISKFCPTTWHLTGALRLTTITNSPTSLMLLLTFQMKPTKRQAGNMSCMGKPISTFTPAVEPVWD